VQITKDAIEISGFLMSVCWSVSWFPQLYKLFKTKSAHDFSPWMLGLVLAGYIFAMLYLFNTSFQLWIFVNYCFGIFCYSVILYFYFRHKK